MATRIPALIFDGIVEIGCLFFLYFSPSTGAPVGAQLSIPVAFSLRQPSGDHGPGARDGQSRHHHASGQEGRLFEKDSPHGCGNVDPAIW